MKVLFFAVAFLSWQLVLVQAKTQMEQAFYEKSEKKRLKDLGTYTFLILLLYF